MKQYTIDLEGRFFVTERDIENRRRMPSMYPPTPNEITAEEVAAEFKAHGFNVTTEALYHNAYWWSDDYKSGYRDEENGYHLFTPCGCNPLSFTASELVEGADWQKTYYA